jgi:predicted O-methyltransferase YrrM
MEARFAEAIHQYCKEHSSDQGELLWALERETHLKTLAPQMISGPLQGKLLEFLSKMIQPKFILEIGTFTGYSALCLAKGLQHGGKLTTIEVNRELRPIIEKYIQLAGFEEQIQLFIGKAEQWIPDLPDNFFDLIFIDAGKKQYQEHYELVLPKLKLGGWIFCDNVLWSGKVIQPDADKETSAIHAFNESIAKDGRVEKVLLPLRDGLYIIRKK